MSNSHSTHDGHAGVPPRVLLTLEEAAQALGISRSKLYELLRAGAIECVRIDRLRRIPLQALHQFVERLREA
jgi:excisionase family DNA binding protein